MDLTIPMAITRLEPQTVDLAGKLLAQIFFNDPLFVVFEPDPARRPRILDWYLTQAVRYCMRFGEVDAAHQPAASIQAAGEQASGLEGIACWLPPGQTDMTIGKYLRVGLRFIPLRVNFPAIRRAIAYDALSRAVHHTCAPGPHWYLNVLGVPPERQGHGIGSELVKARLASFDASQMPCYLETDAPRNLAFYRRLGFQVVYEGKIPGSEFPFWGMLREPC